MAIHRAVRELNRQLCSAGGVAVFGNDDGYAIGPPELVFDAVQRFAATLKEFCNLELQVEKTKVYHASGTKPPQAPVSMPRAGIMVAGQWLPGFQCYGVAIGAPEYVHHVLGEKVAELSQDVDKVMDLLKADNQSAWVLLSTSFSQQLDYLLTLQYPHDMRWAAEAMDAKLWEVLEGLAGQERIPQGEEGLGVECILQFPEGSALEGRSYQRLIASQPIKLGGLGRRELVETIPAAFMGGIEQAIPYMVARDGEQGICPNLEDTVGKVEGAQRWRQFLDSRSRTSQEFSWCWTVMAEEARQMSNYLGKEFSGVLAEHLTSAGGESCNGSTRRLVVEQRESLRHQFLSTALQRHPDRLARPVTVFQNVADDKVAGRWLLACPSPDLGMSAPVFREALSAHLCLPSPAIRDGGWVGRAVGSEGAVIDRFGDSVMCCKEICGDTWRCRHDTVKQHITSEAALVGVPLDCEVFGKFSDLLPAALLEKGSELEWGRQRQGKVPDFEITFSSPEGPVKRLAELKVINAGVSCYPRGVKGKGTERRSRKLTTEYEKVLRGYDVRFHHAQPWLPATVDRPRQPEPPPGPLLSRFRGLGALSEGQLVAGPWGDCSSHFHKLLKFFAEERVAAEGRATGEVQGAGALGKTVGEVRRAASVTIVRSQQVCLLERLGFLAPGAKAAAQRRQTTLRLQERRKREAQAYSLAFQRGGLGREGRAFVP